MKNLFYGLLALGLAACGGAHESAKPADELTSNDFEALDGWMNGVPSSSLNKEKAHSGVYSVKVSANPAVDYSLGYVNQLGKLSSTRLNKVKLHAWAYLPNDKAAVSLVIEVQNPNEPKPALWDGTDLLSAAKGKGFDKWIEVEKTVTLPANVNSNSQMKIYMWRGGSPVNAYLDDLTLTRVD